MATGLALPAAEYQVFPEPQLRGDSGKRRVFDQRRAQATEVTLVRLLARAQQRFRDHEVEDRVPEKF